jgi:hypothetical protein
VKCLSAIRRLLAILAIAGLTLSPIGQAVMAMPTDMHASMDGAMAMIDAGAAAMPADMPCCPDKSSGSDCGKDCPFVMFCVAQALNNPRVVSLFVPESLVSIMFPGNETAPGGLTQAPPTRPPKI